MSLGHDKTIHPPLVHEKNCLLPNRSLVPKRLGNTDIRDLSICDVDIWFCVCVWGGLSWTQSLVKTVPGVASGARILHSIFNILALLFLASAP